MEFPQTYETTIYDIATDTSATIFVVPRRSLKPEVVDAALSLEGLCDNLACDLESRLNFIEVRDIERILLEGRKSGSEIVNFANYVANARIVPFESSPLGAESLSSIGAAAQKVGSVSIGTYIGVMAAEAHGPFLLITVPFGIVICGASVSLAKWLENNRKAIWDRLIIPRKRGKPIKPDESVSLHHPVKPDKGIRFKERQLKPPEERRRGGSKF